MNNTYTDEHKNHLPIIILINVDSYLIKYNIIN